MQHGVTERQEVFQNVRGLPFSGLHQVCATRLWNLHLYPDSCTLAGLLLS